MRVYLIINTKDGDTKSDVMRDVADFSELPAAIDDVMAAEIVSPDTWSSIQVVIVNKPT